MKIHCNSWETMIYSSESSIFFKNILDEMWLENKEYILSLFKRVKAIEKVNDIELDFLYDFIISPDFKNIYNEKIDNFTWKREKLKNLEYSNMISSFIFFMNKSKVIYILDLWADEIVYEWKKYLKLNIWKIDKLKIKKTKTKKIDIDWDDEFFEKFRNRWKKQTLEKFKYLEFIQEYDNYLIWKDLRSWMYLLIEKKSKEIVIKSKEKLEFRKYEENNHCFILEWENNLFLLFWNSFINIYPDMVIHFIWNELFIINKRNNSILKIWGKMSLLWEWKILEIKWNSITFFNSQNETTLEYDIKTSKLNLK